MRQDQYDEQGERIPFSDFKDYRKLSYLVPDADCDTRGGEIMVWRDARRQPTYDEIEAVLDADVETAELQREEDEFSFQDGLKALAKATWKQENRIRVLEGKSTVTFRTFVKALRRL